MFKDKPRGELNGFLDADSRIQGELHFEDTFRVDGKLTGKVVSTGDLVVGEHGEVDGEIHVGRVFVSGVVRGSIVATHRVELTPGGKLLAEVVTPILVVEEGGFFDGRCRMQPPDAKVRRLPVSESSG
jgi:cytoskeletal protein CcmA (bactofilin family)